MAQGGVETNVVLVSTNVAQENICGQPIPHINSCFALIILILNIFFPGLGTWVTGIIGPGANCCAFGCLGLLQFILAPVLFIGWIWAICTGIQVMRVSSSANVTVTTEAFIQR